MGGLIFGGEDSCIIWLTSARRSGAVEEQPDDCGDNPEYPVFSLNPQP